MMGQLPLTATRLRIALGRAGIKQVELSEKTGIPKSAISQYLSGKVKPKQDKVYLMAKALDVSEIHRRTTPMFLARLICLSILLFVIPPERLAIRM